MSSTPTAPPTTTQDSSPEIRLSQARPGDAGRIVGVRQQSGRDRSLPPEELERRLLEFGFVEGATVELLHEGPVGGDPIAVRLDDMRVALRRDDAHEVWIRLTAEAK
jgi:ferrous iron transport protein A